MRRDSPRGWRRGRVRFSQERGRRRRGRRVVDAPLDNELTLSLFTNYAKALYKNPDAVPDDILEAIAIYEKCVPAAQRLWGVGRTYPKQFEKHLGKAREALAAPKSARFERALKRARKE